MILAKQNKKYGIAHGGYTIIELVVSIGLFMTVALISGAAFLGVVSSNRKTLAVRATMDNLNSAMESMSRNMQTGFSYHCGELGGISTPQDCPAGSSYVAIEGQSGDSTISSDQIIYTLGKAGNAAFANCPNPKQMCVSINGGATFFALTAPPPELSIDGLAFRVYGSDPNDSPSKQPRITIIVIGSAGVASTRTLFNIETSISQRLPDFP